MLTFAGTAPAQQAAPHPPDRSPPTSTNAEFLRAADEVLEEISRLISLPARAPLKKSIRTKQEIREFVIRQLETSDTPEKHAADKKALEKFGLIPKAFDLDGFLVELLAEQIAGLYDPKGKEFYIAEWIGLAEQRLVMAHELVHALHDQHFRVDAWLDAAKPNDDAMMARDAVLEGAAIAGMIDYLLREQGISVSSLPDLELLIRRQLLGDFDQNPIFGRAPGYVRDALLFPYLSGTIFTQRLLRARSGWAGFHQVFAQPPVSTQQILHPDLYLAGRAPQSVELPDRARWLAGNWKRLDENVLGEFGLYAVMKQFLGEERAAEHAPGWAGDRYILLEEEKTGRLILVFRLRLAGVGQAARFFGLFSDLLEKKYAIRSDLFRRPNFFSFRCDEGEIILRCLGQECVVAEGLGRESFDSLTRALGWPAAPPPTGSRKPVEIARVPVMRVPQ